MHLKTIYKGGLVLLYHLVFITVANSINSTKLSRVQKRNSDYQTCYVNFIIHQDKIIRTQDSKAMGAKYLNERDVASRDDCLKLCCETESCDVFVFEEKSPGSCYLFECGTQDDFKCKFTKHQNYTSAVLAVNRQLNELESQIKLTQHEHELTKLRGPQSKPDSGKSTAATTRPPNTKETADFGMVPSNSNQKKGCSKYQFECHTSKECIAIYNACDGIPQCADSSDEAPELGCPTQVSTLPPNLLGPTTPPLINRNDPPQEMYSNAENRNSDRPDVPVDNTRSQWPQRQPYVGETQQSSTNGMPQVPITGNQMSYQNSRLGYGREGEGVIYRPEGSWNNQYPNQGSSQIFTHKGSGLLPQNERYQQHQYVPPEVSRMMGAYNDQQSDISKYYYQNSPYKMFPQNQRPNNWQPGHQGMGQEEVPANPLPQNTMNGLPQEYYYDEPYRNKGPAAQTRYNLQGVYQPQAPNQEVPKEQEQSKPVTGEQKETEKPTPASTLKPKDDEGHQIKNSDSKVARLMADSKVKETLVDSEMDGHSTSPSGAILSLTMGLSITCITIFLIGCRMRIVRRRMKRGGKYAHDADFLVNGMYL